MRLTNVEVREAGTDVLVTAIEILPRRTVVMRCAEAVARSYNFEPRPTGYCVATAGHYRCSILEKQGVDLRNGHRYIR